ncbi:GNAT family N-acetyltransferase [Zooshikella sp. RANM57]|uniref:GNAT family N-acetyltransferase n=1 Tax=Zooshikella sp. RANM57 TaxID=3425863 RepID=UPI003D6E1864
MQFAVEQHRDVIARFLQSPAYLSIVDQTSRSNCFNSPQWLTPWLYQSDVQPLLVTAKAESELLGCLVLALHPLHRWGVSFQGLQWLGYPYTDRVVIPHNSNYPNIIEELITYTAQLTHVSWDLLELNELDLNSQETTTHQTQFPHVSIEPRCQVPVTDLTTYVIPSKCRREIKRRNKQLAEQGNPQYRLLQPDMAGMQILLTEYAIVEQQSWKGQQGLAVLGDSSLNQAICQLAHTENVICSELRLNEQVIAYRLGFIFNQHYFDYNIAYLPKYAHYAPGRSTLYYLIEHGSSLGIQLVDASRVGMQSQHLLFESHSHLQQHSRLRLYNQTPTGQWLRWWEAGKSYWGLIKRFRRYRSASALNFGSL